jgi:hypothetical protein
LTLLLLLSFFLLLKRQKYVLAAACAGLASATRAIGLVLLPVMIWELWRQFAGDHRRFFSYALFCSVLATSGLWLYMAYLWSAFDSPLLFIHNHSAAWQSAGLDHVFISALLLKGFFPLRFGQELIDISFFLLFLTLILVYRKWLPSSLYLFALGVLMLPYLTQTGGLLKFTSVTRYILLAFPVFIVMAKLCTDRIWLVRCITGLFATLLFTYSALFAQWYGIN